MATQIQMPKLGLTMTEGTITEWVAASGQQVAEGDIVMVIETDKVEFEVEATAAGLVAHVAGAGDVLEPGAVAGWLLAEGEDAPGAAPTGAETTGAEAAAPAPPPPEAPAAAPPTEPAPIAPAASATGRVVASPNARRVAAEFGIDLATVSGSGPGGRITSEDVEAAVPAGRGLGGRILSSPNARRVAAELGVDLASVGGTGPGGRITSEDVQAAASDTLAVGRPSAPAAASVAPAPAAAVGGDRLVPFAAHKAAQRLGIDVADVPGSGPGGRVSRQDVYEFARAHGASPVRAAIAAADGPKPGDTIALTGMRGVIAERMHSSLRDTAQLTLAMDVDMDRAVAMREQLKEIGADELGTVPGYTDFVIAAVARALRAHPIANSQLVGDHIDVLEEVNVGMAVAVPDGLIVPVVKAADQLGLVDLAVETTRLATAAREKKLTFEEMEGGTFSVTALGMFGVDMFTPVINPPNAGILGVGRIRDDVAWVDGTPIRVQRMTLSLTWDHRVLDGAPAAEFTQTVKELLEHPLRLLAA